MIQQRYVGIEEGTPIALAEFCYGSFPTNYNNTINVYGDMLRFLCNLLDKLFQSFNKPIPTNKLFYFHCKTSYLIHILSKIFKLLIGHISYFNQNLPTIFLVELYSSSKLQNMNLLSSNVHNRYNHRSNEQTKNNLSRFVTFELLL